MKRGHFIAESKTKQNETKQKKNKSTLKNKLTELGLVLDFNASEVRLQPPSNLNSTDLHTRDNGYAKKMAQWFNLRSSEI